MVGGDASGAERDAPGGERPESTPARFAELELLSPQQGDEVPPGHPALHATWTVIVSAQRWPLDKWSKALQE